MEMLKLRYSNYPKDYFLGVLPNSPYCSLAFFPSTFTSAYYSPLLFSYHLNNSSFFPPSSSFSFSIS